MLKKCDYEHISDSNEWHLWTTKSENGEEHHVSIPLPIIIKDKEGFHFLCLVLSRNVIEHKGYTLEKGLVVSKKGLEKALFTKMVSGKTKYRKSLSFQLLRMLSLFLFRFSFCFWFL